MKELHSYDRVDQMTRMDLLSIQSRYRRFSNLKPGTFLRSLFFSSWVTPHPEFLYIYVCLTYVQEKFTGGSFRRKLLEI